MEPLLLLRGFLLVALALLAAGVARRVALYRRGARRRVAFLPSLARIPRAYLVDVHRRVSRDRYAAVMHMTVAGGFVAGFLLLCADAFLAAGAPVRGLGLAASLAMLAGAGMALFRRRFRVADDSGRRSGGEWVRFGAACGIAALGLTLWFASPGGSWAAAILLVVGLGELVAGAAWFSPMRHAVAGALSLGFSPRPGRSAADSGPDSALLPLDLASPVLGVERATDWDWTRLLNFDACVECGRCEAVCPAFDAGQPLNPKAFVRDLNVASGLARMAGGYAGQGHPGSEPRSSARDAALVPGQVAEETLWSCTTCRACVEACPMMIEHVDAIVDLRRGQVLGKGALPGKGAETLERYRRSDTPSGQDPARRCDWTAGLGIRRIRDTGAADVLLWVGEAGFETRGRRTLRAFAELMRIAEVDVAVLGEEERDCGDLARRLGDEATFQRLAKANVATLSRYRFDCIATVDPHVFHTLGKEYPAFGGRYRVRHHSRLLQEWLDRGRLRVARKLPGTATYHDPCYLGRYGGEFDAPRQVLARCLEETVEMKRSRERSRCCGGGGGAPIADVPGRIRIPELRMRDAAETGARRVAVACPNCTTMLEGAAGGAEVEDIAEILLRAVRGDEW